MNALALLGAVAIGLSLGLTGAGGSILTLPVLVYFAGIPPREAIGLSLFIVGTAALVGAIQRGRAGEVHMKAAGLFVISGMVGAALGARLTYLLSPGQLMSVFAVLMVVVAVKMLLPGKELPVASSECRPVRCLFAGAGVGVLTGFLGVGGGFLLMPALAKFARLPLRVATGTSLAVIACNSAAGFVSHLGEAPTPWLLAGVFSLIAGAGVFVGGKVAARLPEKVLRQTFAVLVLVTAGFVFWKGYKDGSDKPPSPTALAADLSISRSDHEGHLELRRMEWQPAKLPLRASRRLPGGTERPDNQAA